LQNGFTQYYRVRALLSVDACDGPLSNCQTITPQPFAGFVQLDATSYSCGATMGLSVTDANIGAQLLERAVPGTSLLELGEADALPIAAGVLLRMWSAPATPRPEIKTLAEQARIWAREIEGDWTDAGEPYERGLLDRATWTLLRLADDVEARPAEELVLVHGDLHHGNVLRAKREPWLAIDPKPILGEREYDVRAPLCDRREALFASEDPSAHLRRRLDVLVSDLGLANARLALEWALAVELTWCTSGLSESGPDGDSARIQLRSARLLASLLD
jgi:streptomycin 6-kinase